jgi:hypothetical protein
VRRTLLLVTSLAVVVLLALLAHRVQSPGMHQAALDPACSARIVSRRPLRYRAGADPSLDRPEHVRAASGIAWVGAQLAVVQDDANFVALVDPQTGLAEGMPLPVGPDGSRLFDEARGSKNLKLDLESCFVLTHQGRPRLVAFGSGSKAMRERVLVLDFAADARSVSALQLVDAASFYSTLHVRPDFIGGELNLEGALVRGDRLLLFQRGNGAAKEGRPSISAVGELSWPAFEAYLTRAGEGAVPQLERVTPYELGSVEGVRYSFTDATLAAPGDGSLLFLASAEASSDSISDGLVHGTRVGLIARDGSTRMATLQDEAGRPSRVKAEGIVLDPHDSSRAWVVVDMDDPTLPSALLEVRLHFPE